MNKLYKVDIIVKLVFSYFYDARNELRSQIFLTADIYGQRQWRPPVDESCVHIHKVEH